MKFKLGQKVLISEGIPGSLGRNFNRIGDVGIITEIDKSIQAYRVTVPGKNDYGNWVAERHLELTLQTGEDVQEYLKSIGMEDQMLRQLMMTMPLRDVSYYYGERVLLEKEKAK